jgi:hypothetical protein
MVHRAPVIREPSFRRRLGYQLAGLAVTGCVASAVYVLASLAAFGHVNW